MVSTSCFSCRPLLFVIMLFLIFQSHLLLVSPYLQMFLHPLNKKNIYSKLLASFGLQMVSRIFVDFLCIALRMLGRIVVFSHQTNERAIVADA